MRTRDLLDTVKNMCHCPELDLDSVEWFSNLILTNLEKFPSNLRGGGREGKFMAVVSVLDKFSLG